METHDKSYTLISLNDFIKTENIDILHTVAIDGSYQFNKTLLDYSLINKEISPKLNSEFWNQLENDLNSDPSVYENVILFFDTIIKSLKITISNDPIMLNYLQSEDYCNINLNPNVKQCQKNCSNLPSKDRAIFINIVEYSNYIISILRHISSPSRTGWINSLQIRYFLEELNKVGGLILKLLETLVTLEDSDKFISKKELVLDLRNILCFVSGIADFLGTETYAWIKVNVENKDSSEKGDTVPVKNYNAVVIDCYLELLTRNCYGKYPETIKFMDEKAFTTSAMRFGLLNDLLIFLLKIGKLPIALSTNNQEHSSQQLTMSYSLDILLGAIDQSIAEIDKTNPDLMNLAPAFRLICCILFSKPGNVVKVFVNICQSKGLHLFAELFDAAHSQESPSDFDDNYASIIKTQMRELLQDISNDKIAVLAPSNEEYALKISPERCIEGLTMEKGKFPDLLFSLLQSFAESYCEIIAHNKSVYHPMYYEMYKEAVKKLF